MIHHFSGEIDDGHDVFLNVRILVQFYGVVHLSHNDGAQHHAAGQTAVFIGYGRSDEDETFRTVKNILSAPAIGLVDAIETGVQQFTLLIAAVGAEIGMIPAELRQKTALLCVYNPAAQIQKIREMPSVED